MSEIVYLMLHSLGKGLVLVLLLRGVSHSAELDCRCGNSVGFIPHLCSRC